MTPSAPKGSNNSTAMPHPVTRALRQLGHDLSVARRTRRWTQQNLAQRMDTSVSTVRRMEDGNPGTALHTFLRALHVLGRLEDMVRIMALDQDTLGLELTQQQLPQRVRSPGGKKTKARPSGAPAEDGQTTTDEDELKGF
ncbi:helix-turn-helix domain-containing protein [Alcanivorax sp. 24]|uniref:helix-turn-helix domain-containing protein n=1 Tax=Alcanivorax sp. 24 TaxID=2545266 RepID=UPI00196AF742|nr:helix-turn-helix domain-containing protein [Alcanivorax sp. 24]